MKNFQGIPCLFKHFVAIMLREQRESDVIKKHGGPSDMDFFSDTERFGSDGVFSPWRFFFPSHLAATEPFSFSSMGSKQCILKSNSPEFLARC